MRMEISPDDISRRGRCTRTWWDRNNKMCQPQIFFLRNLNVLAEQFLKKSDERFLSLKALHVFVIV